MAALTAGSDMDVSDWSGRGAIEEWLGAQAERPDADLDLARMALAVAALDRPPGAARVHAEHLARLAEDARDAARAGAAALSRRVEIVNDVLFRRHGYDGDRETYDDLDNADLMKVIERRKGLPIALSILWLHTARAQGWQAEGVNFPGHFLVRLGDGRQQIVLDPFERGQTRDAAELRHLLKQMRGRAAEIEAEHYAAASNRQILIRLLNNVKLRHAKRREHEAALGAVERMALIAPGDPAIWYEAATIAGQIGLLKRAMTCLERVVKLDGEGRLQREVAALMQSLRARLN
jgi:regulator of sirC expression with transglutaminase-like and TPR domain